MRRYKIMSTQQSNFYGPNNFVIQWNLVYNEVGYNKISYNEVILLVPALYIS